MSWVDNKYKDRFGEQKFPEDMKQKGWDSMQSLLDAQMPPSIPKSSPSGPWYWAGVAAVVATIIGLPIFIFNQPESKTPEGTDKLIPTTVPAETVADDAQTQTEQQSPSSYELTPEDIQPANAVVDTEGDDQNTRVQNEPTESNSVDQTYSNNGEQVEVVPIALQNSRQSQIPDVVAVEDERPTQDETGLQTEYVENGEQVMAETLEEDVVVEEIPENERISTEVVEPIPVEGIAGVDGLNEVVQEGSKEVVEADGAVTSEENVEAGDNDVSAVVSEQEESEVTLLPVAEEEIVAEEDAPEAQIADRSTDVELEELNASEARIAHLAFLDAEEDASIPDLSTLSKERFALSIWGGYLFTGKVMSGEDEGKIDQRKSSEKPVYTFPTGVSLDYFLDENWTVGLGVGWAEYGEEVDYALYKVTSQFDTLSIDGRYDSPSNYPNIVSIDSTRVIDSVNMGHWNYNLVNRTDDSSANTYQGRNVFRYIEVPLTVGYRFGTGRIKSWVKGGLIVGLPVEATYTYPQLETGEFARFNSQDKLNSIQYSAMLQAGADYYLSRALSLRLNVLGTYQINPALTYEGIRQRYYRLGVTFGVAYNL